MCVAFKLIVNEANPTNPLPAIQYYFLPLSPLLLFLARWFLTRGSRHHSRFRVVREATVLMDGYWSIYYSPAAFFVFFCNWLQTKTWGSFKTTCHDLYSSVGELWP